MLRDQENIVSDGQDVTSTANSTDSYDVGDQGGVLGYGYPKSFMVKVNEDFAGLTSLQVAVVASDNANLSSFEIIEQSDEVPVAELVNGVTVFAGKLNGGPKKRYYGFRYIVSGTATEGSVDGFFNFDIPEHETYKSGYTVNV